MIWEIFKSIIDSKYFPIISKTLINSSIIGATYYLGYGYLKKKYYWKYLDWKNNDVYDPKNLTKHTWISGVQGSGKSNKLRRIFINSFVKKGLGGIYIDTHGTADQIMLSIPPNRWKDVIYIAPWMKRAYGINVLKRYSDNPSEIDRIAEDVVDVFHKIYPRSWGDKIANAIRFATKAVLITANKNPNFIPTLMDIHRVLTDEGFRRKLQINIGNEIISNFLEELKTTSATGKLENPLSTENVLLFLCQQNGIDIYKCMEENKIIICNFDKGELSESANLMAGLLISVVTQCAAKRKEGSSHSYFAIAADEFYEYSNKHINTLIAQMRKKNVCLLLANQYRDQLPKDSQAAISMCQNKFIFTIADEDLRWVSNLYKKWFDKDQLISMPFYTYIHDEHNPNKSRSPKIMIAPYFKGDYDWDYVHKLKFASLSSAPKRYELLKQINQNNHQELLKNEEKIVLSGELIFDA